MIRKLVNNTDHIKQIFLVSDGYVSCTLRTSNFLNFTAPSDTGSAFDRKQIDLSQEAVHQLLAYGPQASSGFNLAEHDEKAVSSSKDFVGIYNPAIPELRPFVGCNAPDYQGKKCLGESSASECVEEFSCSTLVSYEGVSTDAYFFELQLMLESPEEDKYIGVGLSHDDQPDRDSFIICDRGLRVRSFMTVDDGNGGFLPVVLDDPNYGISQPQVTLGENYLYCSFVRQANMSITTPSSVGASQTETVDFYMNTQHYFTILANGTRDANGEPADFTSVQETSVDYTTANRFFDPRYENCFDTVGCFGIPFNCIETRSCDVLLTYAQTEWSEGITDFTLSGVIGDGGYMAVGLSSDTIMGSDLVFVCSTYDSGDPTLYKAWNPAEEQFNYAVAPWQEKEGILEEFTSITDNMVSCEFVLNGTISVVRPGGAEAKFDLRNSYHILLATGGMTDSRATSLHTQKLSSGNMVDFKSPEKPITEVSPALVKAHAACMIIAWFFAGSSGIFIAMYMKKQFGNMKILGKDAWFPLHQLFMILTWLLGIAGLATIVAHYEFRPLQKARIKNNPHSLVGLMSILLMFIQPFLAVLRCGALHPLRPVFNVIHFLVGFVAMMLSMAAVYLTTLSSFPSALLKEEVEYVTIAYMTCFGVLHLCMMIYAALKWNTREANDKIITVFAAIYFLANIAMTITLLVYVLDSEFLISTVIETITVT